MNRVFSILIAFTATLSPWWAFADGRGSTPKQQKNMTLDAFAQATINVISDDGIGEYLPTIVLVETQEFRVIEGIPDTVDHRTAIQNVIRRSGYESKEFFFGVRSDLEQITIGHYRPKQPTVFMRIIKTGDGYSTKPLEACDWWEVP